MTLIEKRKKLAELMEKLTALNKPEMSEEEERAWNDLKVEYDTLKGEITQDEKKSADKANRDSFVNTEGQYVSQRSTEPTKPKVYAEAKSEYKRQFRSLGEQLAFVKRACADGARPDERLLAVNAEVRAASGMNESIGSDGGWALEPEFAGTIFETAVQTGDILSRVDTKPTNSNGVKWIDIDETSVESTVYGGVIMYWAAEAATVTKSAPKLAKKELDLEKLMGIAYSTDELEEDAAFASSFYEECFSVATNRALENSIINGAGAGVPLGILKAPCLVSQAKESGQQAGTIIYENVSSMWSRMPARQRKNAVWLIHPDCEPQMGKMVLVIGTGGVPVYLPASGVSVDGFSTLFGRPVIPSDLCSTIGSKGDVILADFSQYMLLRKAGAGMKFDTSIHVRFVYDEQTFRIVFRANGMPKKSSAVTIKNSSTTRGSFITLDARA